MRFLPRVSRAGKSRQPARVTWVMVERGVVFRLCVRCFSRPHNMLGPAWAWLLPPNGPPPPATKSLVNTRKLAWNSRRELPIDSTPPEKDGHNVQIRSQTCSSRGVEPRSRCTRRPMSSSWGGLPLVWILHDARPWPRSEEILSHPATTHSRATIRCDAADRKTGMGRHLPVEPARVESAAQEDPTGSKARRPLLGMQVWS